MTREPWGQRSFTDRVIASNAFRWLVVGAGTVGVYVALMALQIAWDEGIRSAVIWLAATVVCFVPLYLREKRHID